MTQVNIGQAITDNGCDEYGFHWEAETVQTQAGPNGSDRSPVNTAAQIAVMTDVEKFNQAFPGYLIAMADGTSLRVACQRIGRKFSGKDIPGNRKAVMDHLTGVRIRTTGPAAIPLPDGTKYAGRDLDGFRAAYLSALLNLGTDPQVAHNISKVVVLP